MVPVPVTARLPSGLNGELRGQRDYNLAVKTMQFDAAAARAALHVDAWAGGIPGPWGIGLKVTMLDTLGHRALALCRSTMAVPINCTHTLALTQANATLDFDVLLGLGASDARRWR